MLTIYSYELYGSYIRKNDDEISQNELTNGFYNIGFNSKLNSFIFSQLYSNYSKIKIEDIETNCNLTKNEAKAQLALLKQNNKINKNGSCNYPEIKKNKDNDPINLYLKIRHQQAIDRFKNEKQNFCLRYNIDFNKRKFKSKSGDLNFDSESGKELLFYFEEAFKKGILRYNDSIAFALYYINIRREISTILQKRFKYVFIDEMQDLDQDQVDLIENIFFTIDSETVIQRIGDKNQAIYSSKALESEIVWKTRLEQDPTKFTENFSLNNSHRLSSTIANLVDGFVLNRDTGYKVIGKSENRDIAPYLLVYKDESDAEKLKSKFIDLITKHELNQNRKNVERGFHIIGWTTDKNEESDKWYLRKVFPEYSKESKQKKEDFDCLRKYLFLFDQDKKTFESIRKSLLNGIIRVLRIEHIYFDTEAKKHFRKSNLMQLVKNKGGEFYQGFNQKLFNWCYSIITTKNYEQIFTEYSNYIRNELIEIISDFKVSKSGDFIDKQFDFDTTLIQTVYTDKATDITIKFSSIHGVKGQTHCATMYIETDYYNSETHKLNVELVTGTKKRKPVYGKNPLYFQEQDFSHLNKTRSNETLKMMYVGFSRPTHLLCFAVREQNIENDLEKYEKSGWNVLHLNI